MPAAPELVLSDLRGPMNATKSRFDVIGGTGHGQRRVVPTTASVNDKCTCVCRCIMRQGVTDTPRVTVVPETTLYSPHTRINVHWRVGVPLLYLNTCLSITCKYLTKKK